MGKTEKTAASPTEYMVLRLGEQPGSWTTIGDVEARNSTEAIRRTVSKLAPDDRAGVFVAVPVRSWKPVTVRAEVQTRLKLESVAG